VDADSAAAVAANTNGVKELINDIQVDPVSPMDDSIRIRTFRTIYGFPWLNKYAMDPGKSIVSQFRIGGTFWREDLWRIGGLLREAATHVE
jgi:hypothetical protein